MENDIQITHDEKQMQFKSPVGEEFAHLDYRFYKDDIALMHTFVPVEGRGKGYGPALAKFALEYAKANNLKIMVYCPFVAKYIKQHPEYEPLIDKQYHQ